MPKNFSTRDVEARLRPHAMCSQLAKVQIAMNNGSIFARIAIQLRTLKANKLNILELDFLARI